MLTSNRRAALQQYFVEVARDLVSRGVVRRQHGQSLEDIALIEFARVLQEIPADCSAVLVVLGGGIIDGASAMVARAAHPLAGIMSAGLQALANQFKPKR